MKDIENILGGLRSRFTLTRGERGALRAHIAEAMRARGVTFSPAERLYAPEGALPAFSGIITFIKGASLYRMPALAIALILALSGGGTAFAAEGAVPGDLLYPVKVNVDEHIKEAFAFSDQAKANVAAELAAERLKEAATLAARGDLSASANADLKARLAAHLDDASAHVKKLSDDGDVKAVADVDARLETSLAAFADALASLQGDATLGTTTKAELLDIVAVVRARQNDEHENNIRVFTNLRANATTTAAALSAQHDAAMTALASARSDFANASSTLSAGASVSIAAHLAAAAKELANGEAQATAGNNVSAFVLYQNSIRLSFMASAEVGARMSIERAFLKEPAAEPLEREHGRDNDNDNANIEEGASSTTTATSSNEDEDRGGSGSRNGSGSGEFRIRIEEKGSGHIDSDSGSDDANVNANGSANVEEHGNGNVIVPLSL